MFWFTAAAHFNSMRADLVRMVPSASSYPAHAALLQVALVVFLLAVLPANIHAALSEVTLRGTPVTPPTPRVALQALFIGLVVWCSRRKGRFEVKVKRIVSNVAAFPNGLAPFTGTFLVSNCSWTSAGYRRSVRTQRWSFRSA
jgi:hypothetical protein